MLLHVFFPKKKNKKNYIIRTTPRRRNEEWQSEIADVASSSSGLTAASFQHWHLSCPRNWSRCFGRENHTDGWCPNGSLPRNLHVMGSSHEAQLVVLLIPPWSMSVIYDMSSYCHMPQSHLADVHAGYWSFAQKPIEPLFCPPCAAGWSMPLFSCFEWINSFFPDRLGSYWA